MPWFNADLSPRRPGFSPVSFYVGFVAKCHWDRGFYEFFAFPLSISSTVALQIHVILGTNNRSIGGRISET
jgi:hypothetical protein